PRRGQDPDGTRLALQAGPVRLQRPRPAARRRRAPKPAGGARSMRLGRIPWINAAAVNAAMDRGIVEPPEVVVSATAAELNDLLAASDLDPSVVAPVAYVGTPR